MKVLFHPPYIVAKFLARDLLLSLHLAAKFLAEARRHRHHFYIQLCLLNFNVEVPQSVGYMVSL